MNVTVYSRNEIEDIIEKGQFPDNTAVISFYDPKIKRIDPDYTHVNYEGVCSNYFYSELSQVLHVNRQKSCGITKHLQKLTTPNSDLRL